MDCPKCLGKLSPSVIDLFYTYQKGELKGEGVEEQLELDQCFLCAGVWFDKGELEKYLKEGITIEGNTDENAVPSRELNNKIGKCPRCGVAMKKEKAKKDSSVTIDTCEKCGGVWLDDVELDRLERANIPLLTRFFKKVGERLAEYRQNRGQH